MPTRYSLSRRSRRLPVAATALGVTAALAAALATGQFTARAEGAAQVLPAPTLDVPTLDVPTGAVPSGSGVQTAVLSGGCFWGVQGVFEHVRGVRKVLAGYAGGAAATAQYETVSAGDSGHAESVEVWFDPKQISYGRILQIFFSVALDPTQVNRQGPDEGTQYRSEIFTADLAQHRVAVAYIAQLGRLHVFSRPIATRVDPLAGFYPAETYHQDYLERHPDQPYIVYNDLPKVESLRRLFPAVYLNKPVLALQTP